MKEIPLDIPFQPVPSSASNMLVSHLHKFIFLQTGKTAASSALGKYFERFCMPPGEWKPYDFYKRPEYISETGIIGEHGPKGGSSPSVIWLAHTTGEETRNLLGYRIWNSYFKFGSVRNPYDTCICRYYADKTKRGLHIGSLEEERIEFEKWLLDGNYQNDKHIYTVDGKPCFDDVIRFESLHYDLERICIKLGLPFDLSWLPGPPPLEGYKKQTRPIGATTEFFYSEASKQALSIICAEEFEQFNYSFPC